MVRDTLSIFYLVRYNMYFLQTDLSNNRYKSLTKDLKEDRDRKINIYTVTGTLNNIVSPALIIKKHKYEHISLYYLL